MFKRIKNHFKKTITPTTPVHKTEGPITVLKHYEAEHKRLAADSVKIVTKLIQGVIDRIEDDFPAVILKIGNNALMGHGTLISEEKLNVDSTVYNLQTFVSYQGDVIGTTRYGESLHFEFVLSVVTRFSKLDVDVLKYYPAMADVRHLTSRFDGVFDGVRYNTDNDTMTFSWMYKEQDQYESI